METAANASLISYKSTSVACQSNCRSNLVMAPTGANVNHSGSRAKLAYPRIRASGLRPAEAEKDSRANTSADAPSEILEELAAVTVPSFLNAGLRVGILATSRVKGVSSLSTTTSPLRVLVVTGAISAVKSPLLVAASARRTDSAAKSSCALRVKSYFSEVASAKQPMSCPSQGLCSPSKNI